MVYFDLRCLGDEDRLNGVVLECLNIHRYTV